MAAQTSTQVSWVSMSTPAAMSVTTPTGSRRSQTDSSIAAGGRLISRPRRRECTASLSAGAVWAWGNGLTCHTPHTPPSTDQTRLPTIARAGGFIRRPP